MDINEQVLAAFQAEHKEQLEGIRSVLAALQGEESGAQLERVDEAFRLAHSMKGGARVCDLRPVERLAHRLENVFEQLRGGNLVLDKDVIATINFVLDAIEDWMAALDRDGHHANPVEALEAIERLVHGDSGGDVGRPSDADAAQRLVSAFLGECPGYLAGIREFTAAVGDLPNEMPPGDMQEAYRLADNLRGSAKAAQIDSIEEIGRQVEVLLGSLCKPTATPGAATSARLLECLDAVDLELIRLRESAATPAPLAVRSDDPDSANSQREKAPSSAGDGATWPAAAERVAGEGPARAENRRKVDSVRVSTESLDRLLRTSRQLVTESACQQQVGRELQDLREQVIRMQRERESLRGVASACLHRMPKIPELTHLARYLETVDRSVDSLIRGTRRLCAVQKRHAWRLQARSHQIQRDVRQARMVPAEAVFQGLRRLVRDLAKENGKQVTFRVSGFDVRADRMVFQALKDPLIHILRNCIVHGLEAPGQRAASGKSETCQIDLRIEALGTRLTIDIDDDGRGLDRDKIVRRAIERELLTEDGVADCSTEAIHALIFQPGFSTSDQVTEIAGRGIGLSVVRDAAARLQGEVAVRQREPAGTRFRISVPTCVSTHRLLIVSAGGDTYAIPFHGIARLLQRNVAELQTVEGRPVVTFRGRTIPLVSLTRALGSEIGSLKTNGDTLQIVIVNSHTGCLAVSVDALLAERDLVIEDLDEPAASKAYLGAILLDNGRPALVLNPDELVERASPATHQPIVASGESPTESRTPRVLVVDDSFTTRTLEKSILEANGYQVGIAVDGVEGLKKLKAQHYDLVISDVEMPRMNGFTLLEEIKKDSRLSSTPVILVTSRARREDQEKGLDLGADAYIVKQRFEHHSWLDTIHQVVQA